jgi:hypothetical protein
MGPGSVTIGRHRLRAAGMLAPDQDKRNDPREQLPSVVVDLMRDIGISNGIGAVGSRADTNPRAHRSDAPARSTSVLSRSTRSNGTRPP